jgi:hypothetical protein
MRKRPLVRGGYIAGFRQFVAEPQHKAVAGMDTEGGGLYAVAVHVAIVPQSVDIDEGAEDEVGAEYAVRRAHGYGIGWYSAGYSLRTGSSGCTY